MSLLSDASKCVEDALSIVESCGLVKRKVHMLTRTWEERKGKDDSIDVIVPIVPNPYIRDYSHDLRIKEGGKVKQGDIMLKYLSKSVFPEVDLVNGKTDNKLIEKFYVIDGYLYEVISVVEDYTHWNVQVRKTNDKKVG